jgi:hypothetical protein
LCYTFAEIGRWPTIALDESFQTRIQQAVGHTAAEVFDCNAQLNNVFLFRDKEMHLMIEIL